jgi:hypothetical protein
MKINKCKDCKKIITLQAKRCCSCSRKWQYKNDPEYRKRWDNCAKYRGINGFKKKNKYGKRFFKGQPSTQFSYKKGHKFSLETIIKFRKNRLGIHQSPATEWKPTRRNKDLRKRSHLNTPEYNAWRKLVFKRDNYACQKCGKINCYLQAHHKHSWIKYPKERFWVKNGITLCRECHKKIHKK